MASRLSNQETADIAGTALWRSVPTPHGDGSGPVFKQYAVGAGPGSQLQQQLEEARQRGFSEGVAAARSKNEAEVAACLQRLAAAIAGVIQLREQVKEESAGEMVTLAIRIASRILHRELNVDPEAILGLVKAALEKAQSKEIQRIRLHPSQEGAVRHALAQTGTGAAIEITPDGALKPGDVLFETAQGSLDASVSTQLREIERGLADRLSF